MNSEHMKSTQVNMEIFDCVAWLNSCNDLIILELNVDWFSLNESKYLINAPESVICIKSVHPWLWSNFFLNQILMFVHSF